MRSFPDSCDFARSPSSTTHPRIQRVLLVALLVPCASLLTFCAPQAQAEELTLEQKASYSIGVNLARTFAANGITLDLDMIRRGLEEGTGNELLLDDAQMGQVMNELQNQLRMAQTKMIEEESQKNRELGDKYLAENGARPEVQTTDSGLQYEVITTGDGAKPTASDRVRVHYTGTTIDGTVFDSSVERGQPAVFAVGGVISGWTEALQMMSVGSKWKIAVPPDLGYGKNIRPGSKFGPDAVLLFDVELLGIEE